MDEINTILTQDQKDFIVLLFERFSDQMNAHYNETMKEEMLILQKYKAGMAKSYEEIKGQRNGLIGCMQDILQFQETIAGQLQQMADFIIRIENYFVQDNKKTDHEHE